MQTLYEDLLKDVKGVHIHKQPADARYDANFWLCAATLDPEVRIQGQENAYKEVVKTAVGGAAGVIHQVDSATTDCQPNENVEALRVFMLSKKIEARPTWKPMHKQPVYAGAPVYTNGIEEELFKVGFCLPAGPYVTDDDVNCIVSCINQAILYPPSTYHWGQAPMIGSSSPSPLIHRLVTVARPFGVNTTYH